VVQCRQPLAGVLFRGNHEPNLCSVAWRGWWWPLARHHDRARGELEVKWKKYE
jgi:hypothetical protein